MSENQSNPTGSANQPQTLPNVQAPEMGAGGSQMTSLNAVGPDAYAANFHTAQPPHIDQVQMPNMK